jgi:NAD(P)-dependent dehydrogenase (short-subunit alcohol dehydrogenase family)
MNSDHESYRSRVALVTGAAGGIGRAVAAGLAAAGWKVAGIDRRTSPAELSIQADGRSRTAVAEAAAAVADRWGRIELLVTAAADYKQAGIGEMSLMRWQKMLDVWLGGTANACAAVLPGMVRAGCGSVVVLAADIGYGGNGRTYVAAASGTLTAFVKSLGIEMAAYGVCVNCLALKPGVNPEWVAGTVRFLADEGRFYAGQVISFGSDLQH